MTGPSGPVGRGFDTSGAELVVAEQVGTGEEVGRRDDLLSSGQWIQEQAMCLCPPVCPPASFLVSCFQAHIDVWAQSKMGPYLYPGGPWWERR